MRLLILHVRYLLKETHAANAGGLLFIVHSSHVACQSGDGRGSFVTEASSFERGIDTGYVCLVTHGSRDLFNWLRNLRLMMYLLRCLLLHVFKSAELIHEAVMHLLQLLLDAYLQLLELSYILRSHEISILLLIDVLVWLESLH